jgi:glycosyltransferase involved in cell wall biosynthesis
MLFKFLKYLQPTHYFTLLNHKQHSVFPDVNSIPLSVRESLELRSYYHSSVAQDYDLSWQAVQKGYIGSVSTYSSITAVPLIDEYFFIRTYFNKAWVIYVLIWRLISLKNPVREFQAYFGSRGVKRSNYLLSPIKYPIWDSFDSLLIKTRPKVSVIIPTLNRYDLLTNALYDLENQDYPNFEVIVVDQSDPFNSSIYESSSLDIHVIRQKERALWLARNKAIRFSRCEYLLFYDDDSRVDDNWIANHLKCIDFFKADISSGVSISKIGAKVPDNYSFFRIGDQLDTGNVLINRNIFKSVGLFDRQFEKQRMGDGEFGCRCYLKGFRNVSNPFAYRYHLKATSGGLREEGSWDAFRTKGWFAPRPIPSVLYFFRRYFGNSQAKWALLKSVPLSIMPYQFKRNNIMAAIGIPLFLLIMPLVFIQVIRSWYLSNLKLKQGPLVDNLDK